MNSSNERLYRSVFAAIVGSKLSAKELRRFVELLSNESEFVYLLQKGLWEFADSLDHSFSRQPHLDFDVPEMKGNSALAEMMIQKVQSARIPKNDLLRILGASSKRATKGLDSSRQTARQLVENFLEKATGDEVVNVLSVLGIEISQDPYLRGIGLKTGSGYE